MKTNLGIAATLLLIILLSQARLFNFLTDTTLGRLVLIILILGISYTHQILGVVSVLFVIIMFNQFGMEGFQDSSDKKEDEKDKKDEKDEKEKKEIVLDETTTTTSAVSATPVVNTINTDSFVGGREGFNMLDREDTMLKGKRSNEVPVFSNARSQSDNIEPTDSSVFTSTYDSV